MKRYCVFDMDGTLLDSMGYWRGLAVDYLRSRGIEPTAAELARSPGAADHEFYGEWIRGYASAEYAATNQALIDLTNRLTAGAGEAQLQNLSDIFVYCSRYEAGFWDMSWNMEY